MPKEIKRQKLNEVKKPKNIQEYYIRHISEWAGNISPDQNICARVAVLVLVQITSELHELCQDLRKIKP